MVAKKTVVNHRKKQITAFFRQTSVQTWVLLGLVYMSLFFILLFGVLPTGVDLEVGQVSKVEVTAPATTIHRSATQRLQEEAGRAAVRVASEDPANYQVNPTALIMAEEAIAEAFAVISASPTDVDPMDDLQPPAAALWEPVVAELRQKWDIEIDWTAVAALARRPQEDWDQLKQWAQTTLLAILGDGIRANEIEIARQRLQESIHSSGYPVEVQSFVQQLGDALIQPNMILNPELVEQARQSAVRSVEPVTIVQGEVVLRRGDVVRAEHIQMLEELGLRREGIDYLAGLGLAIFVALLLLLPIMYLVQYHRKMLEQPNLLGLLGLIVVVVATAIKILDLIDWTPSLYLAPVGLVGMLVTLLLDSRLAMVVVIALSFIAAIIGGFNFSVGLVLFAGGMAGVFTLSHVSQRGDLMRSGFVVGGVQFAVMLSTALMRSDWSLASVSYLAWLNGVMSSIIAIGFLPYLESLFGITSAIKLLELSNPNQKLLRRLLMETPGTYHHSILVGNLAEAAADSIGADGLLARVGATYHDIGKLKRPIFFGENQIGSSNPHDKMAPSLSTLIITSHVKDGQELAKEHKLPLVIHGFITQHHGTDLVKFFYHRAREQGHDGVEEKDYRYPGPKPQTKEIAIVSLADAVEAAVRSLSRPTPGKIEGLVRKIIKDRLNDGQLDECDLTFRDLDQIGHAFTTVLIGIFHARVEYPEGITKEDIEGKKR